ncbi:MAG: ATP-binding protein [Pseudomonadota bacterium]
MARKIKIKAGEVVKDIRSGMSDSDLLNKYGLKPEGLNHVFREILNSRTISADEIFTRYSSEDGTKVFEDRRSSQRHSIDFALPICDRARPDTRGMVHDISEAGLRVRDIEAWPDEVKILEIFPQDLLMTPPVAVEARCCWMRGGTHTWRFDGGFQVLRVVEGNFEELLVLIRCLSADDFDLRPPDPERPQAPAPEILRLDSLSTLTIDIGMLFPEEVTSSGSFDLRGIRETSFGRLLETIPIPALVVKQSHEIVFANRSCTAIGGERQTVMGMSLDAVFPVASLADKARSTVQEVFATRRPAVSTAILRFQHRYVWGRMHFRPVRMGGDRMLLVLVEDLTLEKKQILMAQKHNEELRREVAQRKIVELKLEEALAASTRLRREAEAAGRSKSDFLANVGHELRTPLNAIIGLADILGDQSHGPLNETQTEYASVVAQSGRHLLRLINDVLDLAAVDSGKLEIRRGAVMVGKMLEESLTEKREAAREHGIELALIIDNELRALNIDADEGILKQILSNLLSNAVKFTPDGGRIDLKAWKEGKDIVVRVSDTGIGIKPEDQERIFNAFEQVDASYSRKHKGAGLGLDLTRKLVDIHGGRIWVDSEGEGSGSTFSFTIPILKPDGCEEC